MALAEAAAAPLLDPIVRTRAGRGGSIKIFELPFDFSFPDFPTNPDPYNCGLGTEPAGTVLTCEFQNLTGQPISLLDFRFTLPQDSGALVFSVEDPDNLFGTETINEMGARFAGGGILSGSCGGINLKSSRCVGGHFFIDLVGFPVGTAIDLTASQSQVPEPATLTLFGTALALMGGSRLRRRSNHPAA
jgi:hypothetical protein